MYDFVISKMATELDKDEEQGAQELKDWQRECMNGPLSRLAI